MITPGKYRHYIEIQQPVTSPTDTGERSTDWQHVCFSYALISPLTAREVERIKSFGTQITHKIVMRYQAGITSKFRVKFGERILSIDGVVNQDELNVEIAIFATEFV